MHQLKDIIKLSEPEKKGPAYRWQEMVAEIAEQSGLSFGHCVGLWKKGGYSELQLVLTEFKERPGKNKAAFVNWRLKNG